MGVALETWKGRLQSRPPAHEIEACDALTQVASCDFGLLRLDEEVRRAARFKHAVSCLIVDLDGFSAVNAEYGSGRGDRILQDVAAILAHGVRATDVVARLEGDAFLIVAPRLNAHGAQTLGDRLLTRLRRHRFPMPGRPPLGITATVGTAACGGGAAPEPLELLQRALEAVAHAKAAGGNRAASG